nr:MAG: ORF1 [Torque teno midi virus]
MPFFWRRRNRFWYGNRRPYYKRRKRYARRRKRRYRRKPRRSYRRRRRRRNKVKKKKKTITIKQWQPETIKKCKIKGFAANIVGAEGRQFVCYTDNRFAWIPSKTPGGGGFGYEKYTLKYLFDEHVRGNNIWTTSNTYLDLCRYTGCKFIFYRHEKVDFIVSYSRNLPMIVDKYSYANCQPYELLKSKHKRLIPSLKTQPHGKRHVTIRMKPPRQMINKWFFQETFADTGLIEIKSAAASLRYAYQGCCNENNLVTLYVLNTQFYVRPGWGNANPEGTYGDKWYQPAPNISEQSFNTGFTGVDYTGKTISGKLDIKPDASTSPTHYNSTVNLNTGWFTPKLLSLVSMSNPQNIAPLKIQRYNPSKDTGIGNQIYLLSVLKLNTYQPPSTDKTLIAEGEPLWKLLWGFTDYCNKVKQDSTFTDTYYLVIVSPFIEPHTGADNYHIPVDIAMLQGKGRYGGALTPYRANHFYPTLEHQMGTINAIVSSGPYVPRLTNQFESTWELKCKYYFYFKWGGSELPEQEVENPKAKGTYEVPDKLKQIQISDPSQQKATNLLHAWDWRRGYITKTALKRIYQDSTTDESLKTDSEAALPEKKKKKSLQGNSVPVLQEKEEEIQNCLLSLFEKDTSQDYQTQDIQLLIQHQQQQQQQLKYNLLQLISDLKKKQSILQLQTGLLD